MNLLIQQFFILLWKCGVLRKRHYISTAFEVILPLLTSAVVAYAYAKIERDALREHKIDEEMAKEALRSRYKPPESRSGSSFDFKDNLNRLHFDSIRILYAPDNDYSKKFITEMKNILYATRSGEYKDNYDIDFIEFENEKQIIAYHANASEASDSYRHAYFGISFENNGKDFRYTLFANDRELEDGTQMFYRRLSIFANWMTNYDHRFITMQSWINEAYLNVVANETSSSRLKTENIKAYRFPFPGYEQKPQAAASFSDTIPMIVVFGFIVTSPILLKRLADEKTSRVREMFRLMGLSDWVFWKSTFMNYFIIYAIQALVLTFLYTYEFNGVSAVLNHANCLLIYITFLVYGMSFIMMSMLISVPFNRPVIGVIVIVIFWMISYIIPMASLDPSINPTLDIRNTNTHRALVCLLPNAALFFAFRVIGQKEIYGTGSYFNNLFEEVPAFGNLSHGLILGIMLLSCLICGILIWYLEAVWPWQFGVPKPLYFPFLRSYWCGHKRRKVVEDENWRKNSKFFERRMSSAEVAINVKHLRKEFGIGFMKKIAINDASLDINRGQITVLLGHNGAGKTTMMNIITGMFPPSSGSVTVEGYDIASETEGARRSMSLCPQHNVLYDELTVAEHLKLFAAIKGVRWSSLNKDVENCVRQLNLVDKQNVPSANLSGGMKRKLNLGIALVGDTKIVILDEPTSGLDPDARRTVWDLLQSIRRERTILITTHFMEEADALADRIAIMVSGEVKCCGTPMFLKSAFGSGYQLRIAKGEYFKTEKVDTCVKQYFPNASNVTNTDTECVYRLENGHKNSTDVLPDFFEEFDKKRVEFGVSSCGLSVTTIEDVFLGVHSANEDKDNIDENLHKEIAEAGGDGSTAEIAGINSKLTGFRLLLQQFKGLILKRYHFSKRYLPMVIFQLILPAVLFWLILHLDNRAKEVPESSVKLRLSLKELYGTTTAYLQTSNHSSAFQAFYSKVAKEESANLKFVDSSVNLTQVLLNASEPLLLTEYIKTFIAGAAVTTFDNGSTNYDALYSSQVPHGFPVSINMLYNAILKQMTSNMDYSITAFARAFPSSHYVYYIGFAIVDLMVVVWSIIIPMTLPFLAASYVLFPIHERESKSKLLQFMSGVNPALFWFANYVYDFITHLMCCYIIFGIFAIMDRTGIFIGHFQSASALFTLLVSFGIACIPLAYVGSFIFKSSGTGFAILVMIFLVFGVVLSPTDRVLKFALKRADYDIFQWFVRFSPMISLTKGIVKLYEMGTKPAACENFSPDILLIKCATVSPYEPIFGCCTEKCKPVGKCYEWVSPYTWENGILPELLMMYVDAFVFLLLLFLFEMNVEKLVKWLAKSLKKSNSCDSIHMNAVEDNDVHEERSRVEDLLRNSETPPDSLIVHNLRKKFINRRCGCLCVQNKFVAVKNLTFAVHSEECFGLLGVNGAGKTTTFRMLVGDLLATQGNAFCCGYDIKNNFRNFQKNIGYCPQFDALLNKLTGTETLYLFGRLRGIREKDLSSSVKELIVMTDLTKHADKRTETYSGGTRRKLSLAIALIGNPKLLFLDEPSSGVDPGARRKIWKTLAFIKEHYNCSLVLTSHSMDECEALCGRIAIMVNGEFKCLGNFQHLRSKFGQGYTLKIKVKRDKLNTEYIESVKRQVAIVITSAVLKDLNETVFEYHVTDTTLRWANLFKIMSAMKQDFDFEDYTISDTTLEQIFISFARQQQISS